MIKKLFVISICWFAIGNFLMNSKKLMTLHDCMEYAVSNSTKIRIQEADISDKKLAIRDAILGAFTPYIGASTSASYNFGRSIDPQTNTYFNQTSFNNSYSLSASITIFDGLSSINNVKISKTGLLISQSEEKQIEADICLSVMETFYNVVYNKRLAEVYQAQIETAEKSLELCKMQEELGQKGYADVVQMEADLADRKYDYITTFNKYEEQLINLESLIFWSENYPLEIDTSTSDILPTMDFDEVAVLDYARNYNPQVKMAEMTLLNAKRAHTVAKWSLLPTISLYGGWSTSYYTSSGVTYPNFRSQFSNNAGEYVQIGISQPIYDGLQNISNIKKKKNARIVAENELEQKIMDIESEVKRAMQDCRGASVDYSQAKTKSNVQEEAYRLNIMKLEQGLISPLEFQTANNNYLKAKADEMNSLFQYLLKSAVVKYYSGIEYLNQ